MIQPTDYKFTLGDRDMKEYLTRVTGMCKKWQLVYWWVLRLLMIGGIILRIFEADDLGFYQPLQMAANLVGMFAFEIFQLFPEKTFFRKFSSGFQNFTILSFFLASFGGAFLNLYYSLPAYDKILHMFGCMVAVMVCYELVCAMQLRDKNTCPANIAILTALGLAFVFSTGWELFEFIFDQWFGGDAQHWDLQKAIEEAGSVEKVFMLIPLDEERFEARFALMDTMGDTILNTIGAVIMYFVLKINPYRHKGENNINKMIAEELDKNTKEEIKA